MRAQSLHQFRQSLLRQIVVWALIFALPVNGLSNMLLSVLGPEHRHATQVQHGEEDTEAIPFWSSMVSSVVGGGAMGIIDRFHAHQHSAPRLPVSSDFHSHLLGPGEQDLLAPDPNAHLIAQAPKAAPDAAPVHAHPHVHAHGGFERHRHDPRDGSVIPIGPTDTGHDGPGTAQASLDFSGSLPIPFATPVPVMVMVGGRSAWSGSNTPAWQSQVSSPLDRPPSI